MKQAYPQDAANTLNPLLFANMLIKIPRSVRIHFSGFAEPMAVPYCSTLMMDAYMRGFELAIYTTTLGINGAVIQTLKEIKPKPFVVHITPKHEEIIGLNILEMKTHGLKFKTLRVGEDIPLVTRAGNLGGQDKYVHGPLKCVDNRQEQNVLLPNGDVVLCCMDYGLKHKLGNLLHNTVEEIDAARLEIERLWRHPESDVICRKCFRAVPALLEVVNLS